MRGLAKRSCGALSCVLPLVVLALPAGAENWPGWRGPARSGVTSDTGAPDRWSATENVLWKVPISGKGTGNPVVWGNHVYLTSSSGRDQAELLVSCLDAGTGKTLWKRTVWGTAPTLFYGVSGMASPTPVTDGERLWAFFGTGDVFCFDPDGRLLWQRALGDEYGAFENRFGASSSPLLFEDSLILQCDHYGDSYVVALDRKTGANRWKTERAGAWLSWSSPQLVASGEKHELVLSGSERLDGYDPKTGEKLWTVRGLSRECVPTPLAGPGFVLAVSGPNGAHVAVRPGGRGDVTDTHVAWRSDRGTAFVPSGILVGPRYYLVDDKGIATCFEAATGALQWRKRLEGKFTASPVSHEGRLLLTNESGRTIVVDAARPEYVELERNDLGESVHASPAISGGRIFFRTGEHLICVGSR